MSRSSITYILAVVAVVISGSALPAQAEMYRSVAQGLSLLDFQFSGERNLLGDGITVNANAFYNSRNFDFGVGDLTLSGPLSASVGFTRRGIPGAKFSLGTSGSNLSYTMNLKNGGQNISLTGSALVNVNAKINALGFYSETVEVSNRGTYTTTGLAGETTGPINFDMGPVNKTGNLYADLIGQLTQPFFAANNVENPFLKFSSSSMKLQNAMKSVDELRTKAASGETLSEQELAQLVNESILVSVLGGKISDPALDGFVFEPTTTTSQNVLSSPITPVPEPATLGAMALLLLTGFARRRRIG